MPNKSRLSTEEKVSLVDAYLSGKMGMTEITFNYKIGMTTFRDWVRLYKTRGVEGLVPEVKWKKYAPELKLQAVNEYLTGRISQADICIKYNISDRHLFRNWIKWYNGHRDFKQPNSGGAIYMTKGRKTTLEERIEIVSHCIANNKDYGETIKQYGVSYQQIYGWVRRHEKDGADGLLDHRGKRKSEESMSELDKLHAQLKLKEAENLRLRMENELLKKLEALERGLDTN